MSVCYHVTDKDESLDGIVDIVFGEIELPSVGGDCRAGLTPDGVQAVAEPIMQPMATGAYPHLVEMATSYYTQPGYDFGNAFDFDLSLIFDALEGSATDGRNDSAVGGIDPPSRMRRGLAGTNEAMTSEPLPNADPADIAEQSQEAFAATDGEASADLGPGDVPLEANEADVVEQRLDAPAQLDDDVDEA